MAKKGIDVSSNNGNVNWEQVKNLGYSNISEFFLLFEVL